MPAAVVSFIGSNLVAIGSALGAGAASAGVAMAVGAAAVVAGAVAAQKLISELYSVPNLDSDRSRQATVRGTVEPQKLIYGEALVSGPISFVGVSGTDNRDLYHSIVLAGHPSDSISDIYFDDERIQSAHINASGNVTTGTFGPKDGTTICVIRKLTGSQTTADSVLDGAFSTINSSEHIGTNLTYIVTKFTLTDKSQETWDKFLPNDIKALVKGKKVYDPRQDSTSTYYDANVGVGTQRASDSTTWAWSENPVWCLVDYLTDDRFGMGINLDRIDLSKAVDAAGICDATVSVPGGSEKRYTCNGVVFGTSTHKTNINKLLSSMNGMLTYTNGKYVIRAGAFETVGTGMTLTEDHMTGPVRLKTSFERNERFNTITGTFIDPSKNYKEIEFPKVQITSALTRDNNEELTRELKLSMTNSRFMAQRIAHKLIQLSDLQKVLTFPTNLAGVNISVGDRVNVTLSEFGYTNKTFVCLGWTLSESGTGGVNLTLREDDSSSYADLGSSGYSIVTPAGGIQQGFFGVPDPSGLSATAHVESIELDWTNPANMTGIIAIEVFASPNSSWSSAVKIGETIGTQFIHDESNGVDSIVEGNQRYYWVRARRFPSGEGSDAVSDRNPDSDTSTVQATKGALGALADQDTVGDGQIDDNAVGQDQIEDGAVGTDQIEDDAVTVDKIANTLQSTNYSEGSAGWRLTTAGDFEAGDGDFRGTVKATVLDVEDANVHGTLTATNIAAGIVTADTLAADVFAEFDDRYGGSGGFYRADNDEFFDGSATKLVPLATVTHDSAKSIRFQCNLVHAWGTTQGYGGTNGLKLRVTFEYSTDNTTWAKVPGSGENSNDYYERSATATIYSVTSAFDLAVDIRYEMTGSSLSDNTAYYFRVKIEYVSATNAFTSAAAGSANGVPIKFNVQQTAGLTAAAGDADTVDGLQASQFLRSDTSDTFSGNLTVTGNLTVQGSQTQLDTETLTVEDNNIVLNYSTGDSSGSADDSGITIQDAVNSSTDASLLWKATGDYFQFSHPINAISSASNAYAAEFRGAPQPQGPSGMVSNGVKITAGSSSTDTVLLVQELDNTAILTINGFGQTTFANSVTIDGVSVTSTKMGQWSTAYTYSQVGHLPLVGGTLTGGIRFRNNTTGDNTIIEDIDWVTTAAEGTDDRIALVRAQTSGGTTTTRGGKLYLYTRKPNNSGFNSAILGNDGTFTVTNLVSNGGVTANGSTSTFTDVNVGGSSHSAAQIDIIATDTSGSPAMTNTLRMQGHGSRGQGILFENVSYSDEQWFAGLNYGGNFNNYSIGYDSANNQAEYMANALFTVTSSGSLELGGNEFIDSSRNITATSATASGDIQGQTLIAKGGAGTTSVSVVTFENLFDTAHIKSSYTNPSATTETYLAFHANKAGDTNGTVSESMRLSGNNLSVNGEVSSDGFAIGTDTIIGSNTRITAGNGTTVKAGIGFLGSSTTGLSYSSSRDRVSILSGGTVRAYIQTPSTNPIADAFYVDGTSSFNGQISVTNHGNSSQWNTAYGWGDHSAAGYLTAEADTLSTVTARGQTSATSIGIANTGPTITLRDTNSTGNGQVGYLSFQDNSSVEKAWIGYGSSGNSTFTIRNSQGHVLAHGSYFRSEGYITTPYYLAESNGSAGSPAYSFASDTNTGMYRYGEDDLMFSVGGQDTLQLGSGFITQPRQTFTHPASAAGWYKIAKVDSRGGGRIIISYTGGNFAPNTYIIDYFKNWSSLTELKLNQFGNSNYITNVRIRQDSSDSKFYIEIYLANVNTAQAIFIYDQRLLGYNATTTLYTGTLSAGSSSGTTYAEETFTTSGLTTSRMTVADHLGVGVQANASYALYAGGDIAQSSGSITAFGNVTAGNGYVKAGTNSGGGFWVGSSQVIDHNGALTVDNIDLNIGTNTNGIKVTGSSSSLTDIQIANTGSGDAVLWFDASNGDFVGSDYASIRQTNTLALQLSTQPSGGNITFKPADSLALTLNTDQTATFEKSIVLKTPNGYSTDGGRLISSYYSGNDVLAVISQDRSSGALTFGYGAESSTTTSQQFVSTFDNFSGNRSAMQLRSNKLTLWGTNGGVQTTVGDQLTTMTNRITLRTDTGNIVTTGSVTLGNNIVFSGISQNAYVGIIPETDQNLMLGTGSGSEPRIYLKGTGNGQSDAGELFIGAGTGGVIRLNNVVSIPSTSYFTGNSSYGYRFNDAADTVNLVIIDDSGNFSVLRGTSTIVSDAGTDVVESIRNPSTSWGEYALTRYGTEGANFRYMDFGYYRGTSEATRGLVMRSQAGTTLHHFYDDATVKFGGDVIAQKANVMFHARSSADSQIVGFRAGYQDHGTLQAFFRYATGDAQLYIDNDFNGNNGNYSNINFRNKANSGTTLINRMTIHGSTGHVNITGGDLQMQGTSLVDSSRNVTANTVTAQGASGGFFYAEDTTTGTAADELIGGFLFKSNDGSGNAPHYAGMTARTTNIYGAMALEFFADRSDYENDTPAMRLYSDGTDSGTNTLNLQGITSIEGVASINSSGRSTFDAVTITDDGEGSPTFLIQTDDDNPWAFQFSNASATAGGLFQAYVNNNSDVYFRTTKTGSYQDWYFQVFDAQTVVTAMRLNEDGIYSSLTADLGAVEIGGVSTIASTRRFYAGSSTLVKPAFSFDGESNTGWWKPATGEIAFTSQGTEYFHITSAGEVQVPDGKVRIENDATSFDAFILGNTSQTQYTNTQWQSNSGNAQVWKAGSLYSAWGGVSAFNIYNSNGLIALHPSGTANVLVAASDKVYTGQPLGVNVSDFDDTNLALDVNGNASIRRGFSLYFGVNSNSFNSWQTRLRNSGSTVLIDGQELQHTNAGYGSSLFFQSNSTGFNINTGDLLIAGTTRITNAGNARLNKSYRLNDNYIEHRLNTPYFTNSTSNLAVDITLGNVSQNTVLEILVTGGYSFANTTGLIRRRWNFGANANNSIWQTPTIIDETIEGPIVNHLFVSDPFWDSSASTYKIRIYKKDSAGNSYNCLIRNFSVNAADDLESSLSMGSLLTSTSTTSSHSAGTNASSGYRVAGNAFVDSSRNVTVGNNIYFGGASNQSTIAGGTHLYYYADGENKFYTYDGSWTERARITDSGMNVYGALTASGSNNVYAATFTGATGPSVTSLGLNVKTLDGANDVALLVEKTDGTDLFKITGQGVGSFSQRISVQSQDITGTRIQNWQTAYGWGDHASAGYLQNNASISVTNATVSGQLNVASGLYEGSIVFGTSDAWHSGIRQHDDGDAELRIWHKHSTRGRIHIATAYDGEPASITRPTTGIIVYGSGGDVGIGDFSTTTPSEKLQVKGNIIATAGTPIIASVSTTNSTNASVRATHSTIGGTGMYMDYHPNSAVGFIDNTYPRTAGHVYGDIEFRQSDAGSMVTRAKFDNNSRQFRVYQGVVIGDATHTTAQLVIEAENTAGAPATTTSILMKGYESRAQGMFFTNVSYSGQEWFAGMQYGGGHQMYQIGYDASGSQAEYGANRIAGFYSDGTWYHKADVLVDASRNIKPASVDNGYGTSIKPSYSFEGDSNTGFYRSAADEMTFLNGGSSSLVLRSDQSVRTSSYFRSEESVSVDNEAVVHAAHYAAAGSSQSGAILIQLPGNRTTNYSMAVFRITTYEYSGDAHNIYYVSGHDWTSGWYNVGCTHHGLNAESVKLINNTTTNKQAILIGATGTSRSYLHVSVDIIAAPSFYTNNMDWQGTWSIDLVTSLSGWDHANQSDICRTALVANQGNKYYDAGTSGRLYFGGNSRFEYYNADSIKHENGYGHILFGPLNGSGAHIYTDLTRFYFNEKISLISGQLTSYNTDLVLLREENSSHKLTLSTTGITATGNVTAYSDERLKDNIETLDGSKVYDMRGVSFTKDGHDGSGVIAQELEKVAPELVQDDGEYKSVAYGNLVGYLIEAVKDQKALIENLTQRIEELENGNNSND